MGKFIDMLSDFGAQVGQGAIGAGMGLLLEGHNDRRQIAQQRKLQNMQIQGQQQMMDYGYGKQLQMWKDTGYEAQKKQMKEAGINPALMYGMGGGGGQTTGTPTGSVGGANAPSGGGEVIGMGIQAAQMGLLRAQKENIEADTANKKAGARDLTAAAEGKGLANALTAWLQGKDSEGNEANGQDTIAVQEKVQNVEKTKAETKFRIDENERQRIMNNAEIKKIASQIELLNKQGLSQDEITENLKKEGLLKDAEIEWNKLDIKGGNFGKFLTNLLKMLVKPR